MSPYTHRKARVRLSANKIQVLKMMVILISILPDLAGQPQGLVFLGVRRLRGGLVANEAVRNSYRYVTATQESRLTARQYLDFFADTKSSADSRFKQHK